MQHDLKVQTVTLSGKDYTDLVRTIRNLEEWNEKLCRTFVKLGKAGILLEENCFEPACSKVDWRLDHDPSKDVKPIIYVKAIL